MIFYITLLICIASVLFIFPLKKNLNYFLVLLLVSQDFFGWYPIEYSYLIKNKHDIMFVVSAFYILFNINDELLRKILQNLKVFLISYFFLFFIYLIFFFFEIYQYEKNLLASRILFYIPIIICSFSCCCYKTFKKYFENSNIGLLLFLLSLIILVLNFLILINPDEKFLFNGSTVFQRYDSMRVLHGGIFAIIIAILCKHLIDFKNKFKNTNYYYYLTIINVYVLISIIGEGRTLTLALTLTLLFTLKISELFNKYNIFKFFIIFSMFLIVINYSTLFELTVQEIGKGEGNYGYRLILFNEINKLLKQHYLFGIGIQNFDQNNYYFRMTLSDIGIFREILYFGIFGTIIVLFGLFNQLYLFKKLTNNQLQINYIKSIIIFLCSSIFLISLLIKIDLVLIVSSVIVLSLFCENKKIKS